MREAGSTWGSEPGCETWLASGATIRSDWEWGWGWGSWWHRESWSEMGSDSWSWSVVSLDDGFW